MINRPIALIQQQQPGARTWPPVALTSSLDPYRGPRIELNRAAGNKWSEVANNELVVATSSPQTSEGSSQTFKIQSRGPNKSTNQNISPSEKTQNHRNKTSLAQPTPVRDPLAAVGPTQAPASKLLAGSVSVPLFSSGSGPSLSQIQQQQQLIDSAPAHNPALSLGATPAAPAQVTSGPGQLVQTPPTDSFEPNIPRTRHHSHPELKPPAAAFSYPNWPPSSRAPSPLPVDNLLLADMIRQQAPVPGGSPAASRPLLLTLVLMSLMVALALVALLLLGSQSGRRRPLDK